MHKELLLTDEKQIKEKIIIMLVRFMEKADWKVITSLDCKKHIVNMMPNGRQICKLYGKFIKLVIICQLQDYKID